MSLTLINWATAMRLWVDDIRPPPDETWTWGKTSEEALALLGDDCTEISFDHDLGGEDTSMPVARRIEEFAFTGKRAPPLWHIHSANPVGRENLRATLKSADQFWAMRMNERL